MEAADSGSRARDQIERGRGDLRPMNRRCPLADCNLRGGNKTAKTTECKREESRANMA